MLFPSPAVLSPGWHISAQTSEHCQPLPPAEFPNPQLPSYPSHDIALADPNQNGAVSPIWQEAFLFAFSESLSHLSLPQLASAGLFFAEGLCSCISAAVLQHLLPSRVMRDSLRASFSPLPLWNPFQQLSGVMNLLCAKNNNSGAFIEI